VKIVEKESGILGYPQETSVPLDADHHTICKFESRNDPNYIKVKNILKHWASQLQPSRPVVLLRKRGHVETTHLETILGIRELPQTDLKFLRSKVLEGTCQWIIAKQAFVN